MTRVAIPSQLRSYTGGRAEAWGEGATIDAVLMDLDRQYPGIRFRIIDEQGRIRPHMRISLDGAMVRSIALAAGPGAEIGVFGALSGG
jgi:molybdopterin converting factor small subunit